MPRRNKAQKSSQNVTRVAFSHLEAGTRTLSSGFNLLTVPLDTTLTSRVTLISDNYAFYRYTDLSCELLAPGPAGASAAESVVQVLGYLPEVTDTAPTTGSNVAGLQHSVVSGFHNQVGSESAPTPMRTTPPVLKLTRATLVGAEPNKWWKTRASANVQDDLEQQGQLYLATDSSAASSSVVGYAVFIKGWIELAGPVQATQTPLDETPRQRLSSDAVQVQRPIAGRAQVDPDWCVVNTRSGDPPAQKRVNPVGQRG